MGTSLSPFPGAAATSQSRGLDVMHFMGTSVAGIQFAWGSTALLPMRCEASGPAVRTV